MLVVRSDIDSVAQGTEIARSCFDKKEFMEKLMQFFTQIAENHILWTAIASWALAQIIKILIDLIRFHKLDWQLLFATGGMQNM